MEAEDLYISEHTASIEKIFGIITDDATDANLIKHITDCIFDVQQRMLDLDWCTYRTRSPPYVQIESIPEYI